MALISANGLMKRFPSAGGDVLAVDGLTFEVAAGEVVGLLGPNGAGKSTTMRLLAGFLEADGGEAVVNGHPLKSHGVQAKASLGYLPETPPQEDFLTAREVLDFHARVHGVGPAAVEATAKLTRCAGFLGRPMGELSKGMRQRVHLACALVHNPPVLLLDEPTDGLDPNQKHELRLMLKKLANPTNGAAAGKGKAILVSTHLLEEAQELLTRVLVLHRGKIVLDTTPEALAKQGKGDLGLAFRVLTTNRAGA